MKIVDFTMEYAAAAELLAMDNYREEREHVSCLPEVREFPSLLELTQNSLGVAAVEDDRLLGFWAYIGPWENEFGSTAQGIFSPVHAHGAIKENREDIYRRMYQTLAEKLVQRGIAYHTIAMYAHDSAAVSGLFTYGFGMRCMDAVRALEEISMTGRTDGAIACRESGQTDFSEIRKLRACLGNTWERVPVLS